MNVQNVITNGKPTVISTFAGCGGSSLGYKWAGYKELLAIDFDDNCEQTFKASLFHYNEPRLFSIKELKRLASFPDDFQFVGSFKEQWARIGNAVMPKQMEAVAKVIKEQILEK